LERAALSIQPEWSGDEIANRTSELKQLDEAPPTSHSSRVPLVLSGVLGVLLLVVLALPSPEQSETVEPETAEPEPITAAEGDPEQSETVELETAEPEPITAAEGDDDTTEAAEPETPAADSDVTAAPRKVPATRAQITPAPPVRPATEHVVINTIPWSNVSVDGVSRGTTPLDTKLPTGRVTVTVAEPLSGARHVFRLDLQRGAPGPYRACWDFREGAACRGATEPVLGTPVTVPDPVPVAP